MQISSRHRESFRDIIAHHVIRCVHTQLHMCIDSTTSHRLRIDRISCAAGWLPRNRRRQHRRHGLLNQYRFRVGFGVVIMCDDACARNTNIFPSIICGRSTFAFRAAILQRLRMKCGFRARLQIFAITLRSPARLIGSALQFGCL